MKTYFIKNNKGDLYLSETKKLVDESDYWEVSEIIEMSYIQYVWVADQDDARRFSSHREADTFLGSNYKIREFRNAQIVYE